MLAHDEICVMCGNPLTEHDSMVCKKCKINGGPIIATKNIHIENSYNIWSTKIMWNIITEQSWFKYHDIKADRVLNRSFLGMYIEWWIHNVGYYITLPFVKNDYIKSLNERFKHVDLEEHK